MREYDSIADWYQILRRSRKVTHFCSVKVTHLKNRISVGAIIIIHAGGVFSSLWECRGAVLDIIRAEGAFGSWFVGVNTGYRAGVER
jgi:hypothetical protein